MSNRVSVYKALPNHTPGIIKCTDKNRECDKTKNLEAQMKEDKHKL